VRDIERSPVNESIARAIVALANSLGLDIIAEGIENLSEKAVLEHMLCSEGQGYLFAKPLPAEDFVLWIASHRKTHAISDLFDKVIPDFLLHSRARA
jgi:cyclic di-GMP phosphodiesterase Gmr